jgi:hypothetical protein
MRTKELLPMNKLILTAAIISSVGFPTIALAQSSMMTAVPAGSVACRPAKTGETPNAMMGTEGLYCKKVNVAKVMAAEKTLMGMMKPNMSAMEMQHMHAASTSMNEELMLPAIPGTNGNPNN